jgi:hypothetical protein
LLTAVPLSSRAEDFAVRIGTQFRRTGGYQNRSPYQTMQLWRQRRGKALSNFQSVSAAAASTFASVHSNLASGLATLAGQIAANRVQTQLSNSISSVSSLQDTAKSLNITV